MARISFNNLHHTAEPRTTLFLASSLPRKHDNSRKRLNSSTRIANAPCMNWIRRAGAKPPNRRRYCHFASIDSPCLFAGSRQTSALHAHRREMLTPAAFAPITEDIDASVAQFCRAAIRLGIHRGKFLLNDLFHPHAGWNGRRTALGARLRGPATWREFQFPLLRWNSGQSARCERAFALMGPS